MKKVYLLGIVLLVAISLLAAGCGSGPKAETKSRDKASNMSPGGNMGNMNNSSDNQSGSKGGMDHSSMGHTGR